MSTKSQIDPDIRNVILSDPEVVLEDQDLMQALVAANERTMGANIVDLRGIAMARMEVRLDRLEETHRSVIAAAYENLAGTNQIHRAVLRMMEATRFDQFLSDLRGEVADILRLGSVRLVLEGNSGGDRATERFEEVLTFVAPGFVHDYMFGGRKQPIRPVVLRQVLPEADTVHGAKAGFVRSEACLLLNLGEGRLPGLLVLGSEDPHQFSPQQGTDLLAFFGGVFERTMRRWLD